MEYRGGMVQEQIRVNLSIDIVLGKERCLEKI